MLLDTCALIWKVFSPHNLSIETLKKMDNKDESIYISAISIAEIGIKIKKQKLKNFPISINDFVRLLKKTRIEIIPVDETVILKSLNLNWDHVDPADQIIVATASLLNETIVTSDTQIHAFYKQSTL